MLARPRNDYGSFTAAVSFLPLLLPDAARAVLEMRARLFDPEIARLLSLLESAGRSTFPRLFILEDELRVAAMEVEARWVEGIVDDLAAGSLSWDQEWLSELARQSTIAGGVGNAWRAARMAKKKAARRTLAATRRAPSRVGLAGRALRSRRAP